MLNSANKMEVNVATKTKICTKKSTIDFCAIDGYSGYKSP